MMEFVECPGCGGKYRSLGNHWQHRKDHRPPLTQTQREIVTGLMMGDGSLNRHGQNPYIVVNMITERYLEYLDSIFGVLGTGVDLRLTAAECAMEKRESGFRPDAKKENYHDQYHWRTRSHPELHEWDWYGDSEKVWPEDLELTPIVLKHWYCGDGCYQNCGTSNYIQLSMSNERDNTEKVSKYFSRVGLPEPNKYSSVDRKRHTTCDARFSTVDSHNLWDYMGEPLPGFEYKWPEEYH